jgi:hypothetical protein
VAVLLSVAVLAASPAIRDPLLRSVGWALVVDEPIEDVDAIVVTAEAGGAGVLEAADLVHLGVATRVALLTNPPDPAEREFIYRGVPYEDRAAVSIHQLALLGVPIVDRIAHAGGGTTADVDSLAAWCDKQGLGSLIVIGTRDHTRRLRRVLERTMSGHRIKVRVRAATHSAFDPNRWWQTRSGIRTVVIESQKLALDIILHPWP